MKENESIVLGIDVGGTGIKGAIVDIESGSLLSLRKKYKTPQPATPEEMIKTIDKMVKSFKWYGKPIGVGFPSIIKNGICYSASNIHHSWIGFPLLDKFKKLFSEEVVLLNDADAAGMGEMQFGIGKDHREEVVILLTLGTGIGSAIFNKGILLPNTELGQLYYKEGVTENYAANSARLKNHKGYKSWAAELDGVINHIDFIFSPDMFIIGGGVSKRFPAFGKFLSLKHKIVPAQLLNSAGIIGAAYALKTLAIQTEPHSVH